ncbi:MAG: twin-arginine translocase subunit TatC [Chloroflexi bacterium]|nr:twin-arginine translocase subunit TatC [Chloroflexota bacterium]MBL7165843.1 twin-arginine translocase subunit TatC [Dehalococcoidales bacterium]
MTQETNDEQKTSVLDHIRELRRRLLWSVVVVVIAAFACFFFVEQIFEILKAPAGDIDLIFIEMTEGFTTYMKISLVGGIVLSMPFLIYQFVMFVIPALTRRERKTVFILLPVITVMFAGGILFAYYYLIPPATGFLLTFGAEVAEPQIRMSNYVNFITRLLLAIGIMFELPIVTSILARMGVITSKWLADRRRIMIIFSFVLAAFITPTPDAFNQSIVAGTMIILYEISIWLAWLMQRRRTAAATEPESST